MNKQELIELSKQEFKDEINTFTGLQIDRRLAEYARKGRYEAPFFGIISEIRKLEYESRDLTVKVYNFPPEQPMTTISWT